MNSASRELNRRLYAQMLLIRRVEERLAAIYPEREVRSPTHFCIGHEAVAVGVCEALGREDPVFPYYRSHGWYLAKGGDLNAMVAELFGKATGCSGGWGGSMHLIDLEAGVMGTSAIVGGSISHAAGAALAMRMRGKDSVAVVSLGDGAVEEGVFHETLNISALRKLPILFICENNLYSVDTPIADRQVQPELYRYTEAYGIPGVRVDGNDVRAVHEAATDAAARARKGDGPTFLECLTYRFLEHCGPNEDLYLDYRSVEEVDRWRAREPLERAKGLVSEAEADEMDREIASRIDEALAFARSSPFPERLLPEGAAR